LPGNWRGSVIAAALMAAQPAAAFAESVTMAEEVSVRVGAPAEAVSTSPLLDCATTGTCWEVATVFVHCELVVQQP
jgi:hypothetical protein